MYKKLCLQKKGIRLALCRAGECPWRMQCTFLDLKSPVFSSLPEGSSFLCPQPSNYRGGKPHCPELNKSEEGVGTFPVCSTVSLVWFFSEEMLTPVFSNTREKGKYEHKFSTCQSVTLSNCVFRKEKKPTPSHVNKGQYNRFDLLCSLHQLFQFLEIQSFFENAIKIASSKNIKSCRSPFLFVFKEVLARLAKIFRTAKEKKKVFK